MSEQHLAYAMVVRYQPVYGVRIVEAELCTRIHFSANDLGNRLTSFESREARKEYSLTAFIDCRNNSRSPTDHDKDHRLPGLLRRPDQGQLVVGKGDVLDASESFSISRLANDDHHGVCFRRFGFQVSGAGRCDGLPKLFL